MPNGIDFLAYGDNKYGYVESAMLNHNYVYNPRLYDLTFYAGKNVSGNFVDIIKTSKVPVNNYILNKSLPDDYELITSWIDTNGRTYKLSDIKNLPVTKNHSFRLNGWPHGKTLSNILKGTTPYTFTYPFQYSSIAENFTLKGLQDEYSWYATVQIAQYTSSNTVTVGATYTIFNDSDKDFDYEIKLYRNRTDIVKITGLSASNEKKMVYVDVGGSVSELLSLDSSYKPTVKNSTVTGKIYKGTRKTFKFCLTDYGGINDDNLVAEDGLTVGGNGYIYGFSEFNLKV